MKVLNAFLVSLSMCAAFEVPASGQTDIISVKVQSPPTKDGPKSPGSNLSAELLAVKLSGGTLLGNTPEGAIIVKGATDT